MADTFQDFDTMQEFLSSKYYKQALEQFKASKEHRKWVLDDGVTVDIVDGAVIYGVKEGYKAEMLTLTTRVDIEGIKNRFPRWKFFSTPSAAQEYITNNCPLLSLNDVKEWVKVAKRSNLSMDFILEKAEHTIKQKLTPQPR